MQYQIADTLFEIIVDDKIINLPIYSDFLISQTNQPIDIRIKLLDIKFKPQKYSFPKNEHSTYIWQRKKGNYVLWFSFRGLFLDECQEKSVWCLVGDKDLENWELYIPDLSKMSGKRLSYELENRPWLQRLFICYCMNRNEAVMHGALCNINDKGYLFLGDSGVGKSTMCSILEKDFDVYSDDRFIIKLVDNHLMAYGTPWNIKNKKYCFQRSIRVEKIYFLNHGNNELRYCDNNYELLQSIMKQVLHSCVYMPEDLLFWKISIAKEIVKRVECFEFKFVPDKSCLKYILGE